MSKIMLIIHTLLVIVLSIIVINVVSHDLCPSYGY